MFKIDNCRYQIDGAALRTARKDLGIDQDIFAGRCGWSPAYQCRIESGDVEIVNEKTKNIIERVLREASP